MTTRLPPLVPLLLLALAPLLRAGDGFVEVEGLPRGWDRSVAVDEESGHFYLPRWDTGQVVEVDGATGAVRRTVELKVTVEVQEGSLAVRAGRLVVGTRRRLQGFDLATGAAAFDLPLRVTEVLPLPEAPGPWVAAVVAVEDRASKLVVVDVARGVVVHEAAVSARAVGRDGRWVIGVDAWSWRQLTSIALGPKGEVNEIASTQLEGHPVVVGPRQFSIRGREGTALLGPDLTPGAVLAQLNVAGYLPRRQLLVATSGAWSDDRAWLAGCDPRTGAEVARCSLAVPRGSQSPPDRVVIDGVRERALAVWGGSRAVVVDLSGWAGEPYLLAARPPAATIAVGQPLDVEVLTLGAGVSAVTLVDPPAGARLEGGRLVWRPTAEQTGRHRLRVTARRGSAADQLEVPVEVRWPSLPLDLAVDALHLDRGGRRALLIEQERNAHDQVRLTLVDLERAEVSGRVPLEGLARFERVTAALGDDAAYLVGGSPPVLRRLSLPDLKETRRVFLQGGLAWPTPVGSRLMGLQGGDTPTGGTTVALDGATLAPVWTIPRAWADQGVSLLADGGAATATCRVGPAGDLRLLLVPARPGEGPRPTTRLDRRARDGRASDRTWHPSAPVQLVVAAEGDAGALKLTDVDQKVVATLRLHGVPADRVRHSAGVVAAGPRAVVVDGPRLHVVTLPAALLASSPGPLELDVEGTRPLVLRHDGPPGTLRLVARGGKGPYRYELAGGPGQTLDAAAGTVTLDPKAAWQALVTTPAVRYHSAEQAAALAGAVGLQGELYPLPVALTVTVVDAEEQRDALPLLVLVAGPRAVVEESARALAAAEAAARAEAEAKERARREQEQRIWAERNAAQQAQAGEAQLRRELEAVRAEAEAGRRASAAAQEEALRRSEASARARQVLEGELALARAEQASTAAVASRLEAELAALSVAGEVRLQRQAALGVACLVVGLLAVALARRRTPISPATPSTPSTPTPPPAAESPPPTPPGASGAAP